MAFRASGRQLIKLCKCTAVDAAARGACLPKTRLLHAHAMPSSAWASLLGTRVISPPLCSTPTVRVGQTGQTRLKHGVKKGGKGGKAGAKASSSNDEDGTESLDDIAGVSETKARFDRVLEGLKHDLQGLRGGKTDPAMLDNVKVESYGSMSPISSVAQATVKGPQLIVLTVYDPAMTKAVEDAIRESGMGLNPSSEGQGQVNVPIPKPTKESREALVKVAAKHAEKCKVVLRGIRHKVLDQVKKKKSSFPEDDMHQRIKEIDNCTKDAEATSMKMLEKKKTEIMTV